MSTTTNTQTLDAPAYVAAEYADELHAHLSALMVLERAPLFNLDKIAFHKTQARELIDALGRMVTE